MELIQIYKKLSPGKKRQIRQKYQELFGCRSTFYRKLSGAVRVKMAETLFFNENIPQE